MATKLICNDWRQQQQLLSLAQQCMLSLVRHWLLSLAQQSLLSLAQQALPNWPNIYKLATRIQAKKGPPPKIEKNINLSENDPKTKSNVLSPCFFFSFFGENSACVSVHVLSQVRAFVHWSPQRKLGSWWNLCIGQLLSCQLKFQIIWRSKYKCAHRSRKCALSR